jgi:hypothetical protein
MARNVSIPFATYPAGTYGPHVIDGGQLGDAGARIQIQRGTSGTWPLTPSDPVCSVLIEFLYGSSWSPGALATFTGGQQQDKSGVTKTSDYLSVYWPKELVGGVMTPLRPDSVRVTVTLVVDTPLSASVTWL